MMLLIMLRTIGGLSFNFRDLVLYPSKDNEDFEKELLDLTAQIKKHGGTKGFAMLPHQEELLRIVTVYSPFRSFLFYHDMGTGKTVTVILMVENLKPFLIEQNTRALILVPNNMIQNTTFIKELLGKYSHDNKTKYKKWCTGDAYVTKRLRDLLNNAKTDAERKKLEKQILKEKVAQFYEMTTHKKWEIYVNTLTESQIKLEFSNRVLVIDEVQRAKNSASQFYSILEKVLRIAENVYLFVLSGTPMVDDPTEICQPINLCRINEGYTELLQPKTVKHFFSKNPEKQQNAAQKIKELTRGFVSRVKGTNNDVSPSRIDVGEAISQNDLTGDKLNVVYSKLHGKQLQEYYTEFMKEFLASNDLDSNEMWNQSRKICRGIWGDSEILSQKFNDIWDNSRRAVGQGVIVVYSYFISEGIMPFERFLLSKKCTTQFDGSGIPNSNGKEVIFNFSNPKTEQYKTQVTEIIGNYDNYDGKIIQWILGTLKIGTGITICMTSHTDLIESTWNLATAEQFIKRTDRIGTYTFPSYSKMYGKKWNDKVRVHRYCSRIYPSDINDLPVMFQKQVERFVETHKDALKKRGFLREQNDELLTIDEYIYRDTFDKYCRIKMIDDHITISAFHLTNLSLLTSRPQQTNLSQIDISPISKIFKIFSDNPIWTLDEIIKTLPNDYPIENLLETLDRFVKNQIPFKSNNLLSGNNLLTGNNLVSQTGTLFLNSTHSGLGTIKYVAPNHYFYSVDTPILSVDALPLSHFVQPNINLDDYFPMKLEPDLFVPTKFVKNLFEIQANLSLKLYPNQYAGVLENTENNPEVFQLKFCINETESVCIDKYVSEIYDIAKNVGIESPESFGRNRKNLCDSIFDSLVSQGRMLPWATKTPPSIFRAYLIGKEFKSQPLVDLIKSIDAKLKKYQTKEFVNMYLDMIALQYPEQYRLHTNVITKQVEKRFKKKLEKFPLYLLSVLSQLYSTKRPKRFTENVWDITKVLRQKIESIYSKDFLNVNTLLFQLISKHNK